MNLEPVRFGAGSGGCQGATIMADRLVVHRCAPDGETAEDIASRLRTAGAEILESQAHMFLVQGARDAISRALSGARSWRMSDLQTVPPPNTRERVLKPPS
jgi:hypothetical protein